MSWDDTCSRCGNNLFWWRSRSGYWVCMRCHDDPLGALQILARYGGDQASSKKCKGGSTRHTWPRPTLLVKSRWPISNTKGVRVTRDMGSVSLTFERCVSARFSIRF
jgi:hypothetical protein